ncbi:MAG: nucleotidyl transferase AbiEii/AbiGii toxin family protein [Deltaproteobacteria bacterium]|nr:nucleotidyl transferase AbiEii/AbiGii toxin family protein [Deltaproteobacteria bacterium]
MFNRPHHQRIAHVLKALRADMLQSHHCYFGGGTAIVMRFGEYRESLDVDFLVSDLAGYRKLREILTGLRGIKSLIRPEHESLVAMQQIKADQYGIRSRIHIVDQIIKFEIVHEGRIKLMTPGPGDKICGITTLTPIDMATSKLLANSDRFADDSTFNRDIIDLAMINIPLAAYRKAVAKAESAYGAAIKRDLKKCLMRMQERTGWLEQCIKVLAVHQTKAELWQKIRSLNRLLR